MYGWSLTFVLLTIKINLFIQLQPKKSPVKEAKTKLNSIAENTTGKKNVPKSVASPASKNKKDPNAPKAPLTSYFLFTAEVRAKIKAEDPSLSFGEIAKLIGQKWKEIDSETKGQLISKYSYEMTSFFQNTNEIISGFLP
jgi:hypothetical protein